MNEEGSNKTIMWLVAVIAILLLIVAFNAPSERETCEGLRGDALVDCIDDYRLEQKEWGH
ncbi:hypothetical protein LCGC14_2715040 [marine sediment metagenome]|uniref:Uncharacterized protein n=1 Tax=marine sediment metagenome TaxID=412755 RepID=A0A0F9C3H5_9ZZZZ